MSREFRDSCYPGRSERYTRIDDPIGESRRQNNSASNDHDFAYGYLGKSYWNTFGVSHYGDDDIGRSYHDSLQVSQDPKDLGRSHRNVRGISKSPNRTENRGSVKPSTLLQSPLMDRVVGETFQRNDFHRLSWTSPRLDTKGRWPQREDYSESSSDNEQCSWQLRYSKKLRKTIIAVCAAIILIATISVSIILTANIKDVANGEVKVNQTYTSKLDNKESIEYKKISTTFCNSIQRAIKRNKEQFRVCTVTDMRRGSIIILYEIYFTTNQEITEGQLQSDILSTMVTISSTQSYLGDLVIITSTLTVTVTQQIYTSDPVPALVEKGAVSSTTEATTVTTSMTDISTSRSSHSTSLLTDSSTAFSTAESKRTSTTSINTSNIVIDYTPSDNTTDISNSTESTAAKITSTDPRSMISTTKEITILTTEHTTTLRTSDTLTTSNSTMKTGTPQTEKTTKSATQDTTKISSTPQTETKSTTVTNTFITSTTPKTETTAPTTTPDTTIISTAQKSTSKTSEGRSITRSTPSETSIKSTTPEIKTTTTSTTQEAMISSTIEGSKTETATTSTPRETTTNKPTTQESTSKTSEGRVITTSPRSETSTKSTTIEIQTTTRSTTPETAISSTTPDIKPKTETTTTSTTRETKITTTTPDTTTIIKSTVSDTKTISTMSDKTMSTTQATTLKTAEETSTTTLTTPDISKISNTPKSTSTTSEIDTISTKPDITTTSTEPETITISTDDAVIISTTSETRTTTTSTMPETITESITSEVTSISTPSETTLTTTLDVITTFITNELSVSESGESTTLSSGVATESSTELSTEELPETVAVSSNLTTVMTFTTANSTESTFTTQQAPTTVVYNADVLVEPRIIAIVGQENIIPEVCKITPNGTWMHVNISLINDNQAGKEILGTYQPNRNPIYQNKNRFEVEFKTVDQNIVISLNVSLKEPTADICSWKYRIQCEIQMNDTINTVETNKAQLLVTAPIKPVIMDTRTDYNEGDTLQFTCSSTVDPDNSDARVDHIKDGKVIQMYSYSAAFLSHRNPDCSVNFTWTRDNANPLTPFYNGVEIRCIIINKLLSEGRNDSKILNVTSADVSFQKYAFNNFIGSSDEIICTAKDSKIILRNLTIIRNGTNIAVLQNPGSQTTLLSGTSRLNVYSATTGNDVSLQINISSVACEDHGVYECLMHTNNAQTVKSPEMAFIVEGSATVLTILPDFYESFPRLGVEHMCKTNNLGLQSKNRYLQIEIAGANRSTVFTYDKNTPEHLKSFNSKNNLTIVNITGTDKLLIASDERNESVCLESQTIKFMLDLAYAWNGGHIRCILKDDVRGEIIDDKYTINMIPANYCGGARDNTYKLHPDNDCHRYVQCSDGYAYGKTCHNLCINTKAGTCDHCTDDLECRGTTTTTTTTAATTKAMVPGILVCLTTDVFAGETAIITCNVTNDNFNFINISKVLSGNNTEIATILQDGTVSKRSGHSVGKYDITYTQSTSMLTVRIKNIRCEDQSQYWFSFDDGTLSPSVTSTEIIMKAKPEVPKLTISPDLIENQNKRIHTCEANVGNPAGYLQLEIRYPSSKNFTAYSSSDKILQETTENCKAIHMLSFAIDLSEDVNGSTFRCVSKNDKTTNKSDQIQSSSEYVITVIPSDYCTGVADNTLKEYPGKDCHKYIQCHRNNSFGRTCNTLCFNVGICDFCYNVPNCEKATTKESTTKMIKTTTTTTVSSSSVSTTQANVQLICATTNAFEGEIGVIACNATFDSFNLLNISKSTSGDLATVLADGTVHESQGLPVGKYEFSYSSSTKVFNLKIKKFHCLDEGQYQLTLENNIGNTAKTLPNIYLKVKPKVPKMIINPQLVENRKDILHTCEADVGNPGGYLQIEIKRPSSNSFVKYQSPLPKTVKSNCSKIESLLFAIDLTENLNGSLVRCVAINDEANEKSDKIQSSQEFKIAVIPNDFCPDQGDNWFEHPLGCPYYVRCADRLYTGVCSTQNCLDIQQITCAINPSGR